MAKEWNSSFLRVCLVERMTVEDGVSSLLPFQGRAQSRAVTAATVMNFPFLHSNLHFASPGLGSFSLAPENALCRLTSRTRDVSQVPWRLEKAKSAELQPGKTLFAFISYSSLNGLEEG